MKIETTRLLMREFQPEDIEDTYKYLSNPKVMYYIEDVYSYQQTIDLIEKNISREKPYIYALVEKLSNRVIGHVTFHPYDEEEIYELGWIVGEEYQGKGFAFEISTALLQYAFYEMKLHKVVAETIVNNKKSIRLIKKLGFQQEALLRKQNWDHGEWVDEYWYGILEHEFLK